MPPSHPPSSLRCRPTDPNRQSKLNTVLRSMYTHLRNPPHLLPLTPTPPLLLLQHVIPHPHPTCRIQFARKASLRSSPPNLRCSLPNRYTSSRPSRRLSLVLRGWQERPHSLTQLPQCGRRSQDTLSTTHSHCNGPLDETLISISCIHRIVWLCLVSQCPPLDSISFCLFLLFFVLVFLPLDHNRLGVIQCRRFI